MISSRLPDTGRFSGKSMTRLALGAELAGANIGSDYRGWMHPVRMFYANKSYLSDIYFKNINVVIVSIA
jgi:hypothetical protein